MGNEFVQSFLNTNFSFIVIFFSHAVNMLKNKQKLNQGCPCTLKEMFQQFKVGCRQSQSTVQVILGNHNFPFIKQSLCLKSELLKNKN